jgi:hypothetical protein
MCDLLRSIPYKASLIASKTQGAPGMMRSFVCRPKLLTVSTSNYKGAKASQVTCECGRLNTTFVANI